MKLSRSQLVANITSGVRNVVIIFACFSCTTFALSTADHSKFKELQKSFDSGPEVTKTCLSCHTEAAKQIHKTRHWTWEFLNPNNQQLLGKKNILNNFCITPQSNFNHCTSCHVGYGWKDNNFDFTSENNVDCLVCHDTTGNYIKSDDNAGHPKETVDLTNVAQNVGKTSRDTCGACHFFGGGGNGVKHGDMDESLTVPDKDLDVHMDALGEDFTCATCHKGADHDIAGSRYTPEAAHEEDIHIPRRDYNEKNKAHCRACHGTQPHKKSRAARLNQHTNKIACQTCHIPTYARGGVATRMTWDWSSAGKVDSTGKPLQEVVDGMLVYDGKRGTISYAKNVEPEYVWFNGNVSYQLLNERVRKNNDGYVLINDFEGSPDDGKSRIWPVKIFRGVQPYDPVLDTLVIPHTTGHDEASYWENFNWEKAVDAGMRSADLPFSGKVDFIKTQMSWPITHMIAPADNAVKCVECHQNNGRLKKISGIYIPARDSNEKLDKYGWLVAILTLTGVVLHGIGRIISHYWSKQR